MANPILVGGNTSPYSIYQTWTAGVTSDDNDLKVGTRGQLPDGRVYYVARNNSTALVAGNLLGAEAASVDFDDMATDPAVVGAKSVNCTNVGSATYTANELAEGFLCINSGTTGAGIQYKISDHLVWGATSEVAVNLYDPIVVAVHADATAHVAKSPWMDPVIMPTGSAAKAAGVAPVAVALGSSTAQYFWCQTYGMACVTAGSASAVGDALMGDSGTAGETLIATAGNEVIGVAYTLGVDGDFVECFLNIAA